MVYVFKTSVKSLSASKVIGKFLQKIPEVENWNFDLEDCDHILRITSIHLNVTEVVDIIETQGYSCEEL